MLFLRTKKYLQYYILKWRLRIRIRLETVQDTSAEMFFQKWPQTFDVVRLLFKEYGEVIQLSKGWYMICHKDNIH